MTIQTATWLLPTTMVVLLSTCEGTTHQDRAEERTEAEQGADPSRASKEVLANPDPGTVKDGKRIPTTTPEEERAD